MSNASEIALWFYLHEAKIGVTYAGTEIQRILSTFGSLQGLREVPSEEAVEIAPDARSRELAKSILKKLRLVSDSDLRRYEREIVRMKDNEIDVLHFSHHDYPSKLRSIGEPPLVIFHRGEFRTFDQGHYVAIVGTRQSSHRAHYFARELARELAKRRYVIVSGLARGIDTEAHCGALDVGGKTIAVLPNPIDKVYPSENRQLSMDISKNGALISQTSNLEYSRRAMAPHRFVDRNKITSGLSEVVVIVEIGPTEGSLHQFDFAMRQGRRVYVPQPPDYLRSAYEGYENLLKHGAVSLHSTQDVVNFVEAKQTTQRVERGSLDSYTKLDQV